METIVYCGKELLKYRKRCLKMKMTLLVFVKCISVQSGSAMWYIKYPKNNSSSAIFREEKNSGFVVAIF